MNELAVKPCGLRFYRFLFIIALCSKNEQSAPEKRGNTHTFRVDNLH